MIIDDSHKGYLLTDESFIPFLQDEIKVVWQVLNKHGEYFGRFNSKAEAVSEINKAENVY